MIFSKSNLISLVVIVLLLPGVPWASNWQWMKDTEVMSFDEQDWALLENTITQMLNQGSDGDRQQWQNPQTGNSGTVQIQDTRETTAGTCRLLLISNDAKPESGFTRMNYCKQQDGQWKIDPRPQQQK